MSTRVFITGATGYIGGAVLAHFLEDPTTRNFSYSALIRSPDRKIDLPPNVRPVVGDLENSDIITKETQEADLIINTADADNMTAVRAIVAGMVGRKNLLIHNSGTGVLADDARGKSSTNVIYSDLNLQPIHDLPLTQAHKDVDAFLFESEVSSRIIIICPPLIYGLGTGLGKKISQQIPALISASLKAGKVRAIGPALNRWSHVHIEDLADLFLMVATQFFLGKIYGGKDNGWFFCESGEHEWIEIYKKLAEILYQKGLTTSPEIETLTSDKEVVDTYGKYAWMALASNSRSRSDRARQIGWTPRREKMLDTLETDVEMVSSNFKKTSQK